ncbi:coiled-coil domain-containing protein 122 [Pygocentrus nattereri]|uniref:Coiled-coil domain containing 122 n=1 Tax=Pygocentrus nattereri TaxID=42514 RepID=A0AAR2K4D5_PYGNA|nr:coiled-coil domain-containing protein 122 [Pygocentrus nattereri]
MSSGGEQEFSLSTALQAVSQQGESQAVELEEKRHALNAVQATLSEVVKSYEAVAKDIKLKERQITGITCETEQIHSHNETQEAQLKAILMENMRLKHSTEEQLENSHFLLARYNTCRNKMETYKMSVAEMESQVPVRKELVEKMEEVKRLKDCKEGLRIDLQNPEGNAVQQAQKEIDHIKAKIHCSKEMVREKIVLLEKEKETHSQLRKDIEIHNRRCEAIVKRLCCQLNKAQSSHRQLSSDISQMEIEVKHLRNQLQVSRPM